MNQYTSFTRSKTLSGAQKSAILFLCLGEERGGALMQKLDVGEIQRITNAITSMGEVEAHVVEEIMSEFGEKVSDCGSVTGSVDTARGILNAFLPEDRVAEILSEIESTSTGNVWKDLSEMDETALADVIRPEHNQTVAVILSKISSAAAAKVLPLLGNDRAADLIQRMIELRDIPRETLTNVEESIRGEILANSGNNSAALIEKQLVAVFNKLDDNVFQNLSSILDRAVPEQFRALKQRMFVFDDLAKLTPNALAKVMRDASGNNLPLALRGAKKDIRTVFLEALPSRSRDMLTEEMASMGAVRSKDARAAQAELVETALRLAAENEIELPQDEEEDMLT